MLMLKLMLMLMIMLMLMLMLMLIVMLVLVLRLTSLSDEIPVYSDTLTSALVLVVLVGLRHRNIGRVARTSVFEGMCRSGDVDVDIELALRVRSSENSWNLLHS